MKQKLIRLPETLSRVVCDVINERLAGGEGDFRDALGLSEAQAATAFRRLEEAKALIYDAQEIESREHVVTVLTLAEAANLNFAAGNSLDSSGDRIALFGNSAASAAALRGYEKLARARVAVELQKSARPCSAPLALSVEDEEANQAVRFAGAGSDSR
jgi:hypothetical protein